MATHSGSDVRSPSVHARRGFINGTGWLVLGLFLIVALIQIAMVLDRISNRGIAQLLIIPVTLATVVGLVCWGVTRLVARPHARLVGTIGWSAVLLFLTVTRILVMSGVITGSVRGGNLRVNTPGATASNTPATTQPSQPARPAPVMPNPVTSANPAAAPGAAPGATPASRPPMARITHGFADVAEQIAKDTPAARDVLSRHARELQGLIDTFATNARAFEAAVDEAPSIDPAVLRQRLVTVQTLKESGTRYADAAKAARQRIETDLRAEPRVGQSEASALAGRFITMTFTENRAFAVEQVGRAGDDLTRQYQLVLDDPSKWKIDANGHVTSTDLNKAGEYRMFEAKLAAQKRMIQGAIDRAVAP